MSTRSFVDESMRLRRIVTAGVAASVLHHNNSRQGRTRSSAARREAMNLIFRTRPVEDTVMLRTLHSTLIPQALERCATHSPQVASVLQKLISFVVRIASATPSHANVWLGALYVILKSSLVTGPASSSNALMCVPRVFLSPMCVRMAETAPSGGGTSWASWSAELDPVVSSLIAGQSEAAIQLRYRMDLVGITTTATTEEGGDSFLAIRPRPRSDDGGNHWSMLVGDPIEDEERDMLEWAERCAHIAVSPNAHRDSSMAPGNALNATGVAPSLAEALPRHLLFRLTATPSGRTSAHWSAHGCALVAMHFAISGCPDPFGLVWRSRSDVLGASTIPSLVVHGSLYAGGGLPTSAAPKQADAPVRGLVGMLQWAADVGNVCYALRRVVHLGDTHEKRGIIGAIGHAALRALSAKLSQVALAVSHLSSHVAQHVPSVTIKDVLCHWRTFLLPIGLLVEVLADVFCVRCYDAGWTPSQSLDRCSATELLTRLYGVVVKHNPVHRCGADSAVHPESVHRVSQLVDVASAVAYIFDHALKPFTLAMRTWLCTTVDSLEDADPYDEFFIVPSYGDTASGFRVVAERLPAFIAPATAQRFLAAGVARWHLVESLKLSSTEPTATSQLSSPAQHTEALRRFTLQVVPPFGAPLVDVKAPTGGVNHWLDYLSYCVDPIYEDFRIGGPNVSVGSPQDTRNSDSDDAPDDAAVSTPRGAALHDGDGATMTTHRKLLDEDASPLSVTFSSPPQGAHGMTPQLSTNRIDAHHVVDEDLKKRAAQQLVAEYTKKMDVLRHQEAVVRWRARRAGHRFARAAALRNELDDIKAMHAHVVPDKERLTPVGQLVVPLLDAAAATTEGTLTWVETSVDVETSFAPLPPRTDIGEVADDEGYDHDVAHQLSFSADRALGNDEGEEPSSGVATERFVHDSQLHADEHREPEVSMRCPPLDAATGAAGGPQDPPAALGLDHVAAPMDNLDPVPMDAAELLEAQAVGVAKCHFNFVREEKVIAAYLEQETILDKQHALVGTDAYDAACRAAAGGDAFLVNSMWSPIHEALREEEMLEDAIIEPSAACVLAPDEATAQLVNAESPDGVESVLSCRAYFCALSERLALFFVRKSLQSLLHPTTGSAARTIQSLQRVCLMQDTLLLHDTLAAWEQLAFDASSRHGGAFDAKATVGTMCAGFRRVWDKASGSVDLDSRRRSALLVLELGVTVRGDGAMPAAPATAFDVLPSLGLFCVDGDDGEERGLGGALLPPHAIRRYSDLFVSLLFWRWTQKLLNRCWEMCVGCQRGNESSRRPKELWLFCTIARSVVTAVVEYVWYQLSQSCLAFNARLNALVTTERELDTLDILAYEHDAFLTTAFDVTLLGPMHARARKQLRSMVLLVEGVFAFLDKGQGSRESMPSFDAATMAVHKKQLQQRVRDFSVAASLFASHLQDVLASAPAADVDSRRPLAELVARVHAVVANIRDV